MLILGIESSCDETGLALYEGDDTAVWGDDGLPSGTLLGSVLHSQIKVICRIFLSAGRSWKMKRTASVPSRVFWCRSLKL